MVVASIFMAGLFYMDNKKNIINEIDPILEKNIIKEEIDISNETADSIRILFVGDMMFDRYIRQVSERRGYDFIFQKVDGLLQDNDLVIGNLEGPITDSKSRSVGSEIGEKNNYIFTFDSGVADTLAKENIRLVNIGNNHISNFGSDGINATRQYLTQSGIDFFGDPENIDNRLIIKNIQNIKIAFVSYNQFTTNAEQKTIADTESAKNNKADFIVVYAHWGEEFIANPDENIRNMAHGFIENGADLIIGSHPHVIQSKEQYMGKMIYYSLGNFVFDQYFSQETQRGLAIQSEINIKNKKIISNELPILMSKNGQILQQ